MTMIGTSSANALALCAGNLGRFWSYASAGMAHIGAYTYYVFVSESLNNIQVRSLIANVQMIQK